jgi:hypothetical protein
MTSFVLKIPTDVNNDGAVFVTTLEQRQQENQVKWPSASVVLLTFNQERLVQDALQSVLNQDRDDIEIVVSDDCSTDGTWQKIQEVLSGYLGPKKVIAHRNPVNIGIVENFDVAFKKTTGNLIFMAAGDDISLPNRCSQSIQFWLDCVKKVDLVAADAIDMSYAGAHLKTKESDRLEEWTVKKWFERRPFFFGASFMMTRDLLNLAPLNNQLPYEDQCLVFRSLLMGGAIRLPVPLVCHRRGGMTQSTGFKFGHRRSQIKTEMAKEMAELQQFLSDAQVLNKQSEIEEFIERRMVLCRPVRDLFQSPTSIKAIEQFWRNPSVPSKLKYRYLRYYLFYPFLAVGHSIRDVIRVIKKNGR